MNVKGKNWHLIGNGKGQFVGAVQTTTDETGNLVSVSFDPIAIVDTHKVFEAITKAQTQDVADTPPHGTRPPDG